MKQLATVLEVTEEAEQSRAYVHQPYVPSLSSFLTEVVERTERQPEKPREMSVSEMKEEAYRQLGIAMTTPSGSKEWLDAWREFEALDTKLEAILGRSPFGCGS